jgi:hypothetical protein
METCNSHQFAASLSYLALHLSCQHQCGVPPQVTLWQRDCFHHLKLPQCDDTHYIVPDTPRHTGFPLKALVLIEDATYLSSLWKPRRVIRQRRGKSYPSAAETLDFITHEVMRPSSRGHHHGVVESLLNVSRTVFRNNQQDTRTSLSFGTSHTRSISHCLNLRLSSQ